MVGITVTRFRSAATKDKIIKSTLGQLRRRGMVRGQGWNDTQARTLLVPQLPGLVVEEFKLGGCRADLIQIGKLDGLLFLHAYEIKSDRDSLTRLRNQSDTYQKYADFCSLVSNRLALEAIGKLPKSWGVLHGKEDPKEGILVKPFRLPTATKTVAWVEFEMLWRSELLEIVQERVKVKRIFTRQEKSFIEDYVKNDLFEGDPEGFRQAALSKILDRTDWRRRKDSTIHQPQDDNDFLDYPTFLYPRHVK